MDNKSKINLGKKYIKTLEDFELMIDRNISTENVNSLSIVKNYLSTAEFSKILNKYNFIGLITLNLTANNLTTVPEEIKVFKNLDVLILNNNKINRIENLDSLNKLTRIELRSNRIKKFENLKNLSNLEFISVSCNLITELNKNDFGYWIKIEELGLFGNYLGSETDSSENLTILEEILDILSEKIPNLKSLYLGGNYFSKINNLKFIVKSKLSKVINFDGGLLI